MEIATPFGSRLRMEGLEIPEEFAPDKRSYRR